MRFREIKSRGGPFDGEKFRFWYTVVLSTACSRLLFLVVRAPSSGTIWLPFHGDEALTAFMCSILSQFGRLRSPSRSIEEADSNNLPIQSLEVDSVALVKVPVDFGVVGMIPVWSGESCSSFSSSPTIELEWIKMDVFRSESESDSYKEEDYCFASSGGVDCMYKVKTITWDMRTKR
ncbi:hypothetical protein HID58_051278 [Brassica napus]|uniref:Uncharacterized protein n=1 Tax=Brassica napus TaxID=3708 RepID=A0ABQ8A8T1_BRANA|nr:hypothetical protein HID58_051278 [Brassica napus]